MAISDAIEKLGRAIFESPFRLTPDAAALPELAEIRLVVVDAVRSKSHRVGNARVFSDNVIRILLRGVPEAQSASLESSFLADFLRSEIREALTRSAIRFPDDLEVRVQTTNALPSEGEGFIAVESERPVVEVDENPAPSGDGWVTVLRGEANVRDVPLKREQTNIGRTVDVFRNEGPSRRNDLAFSGENEIGRTVSREHAHILFDRRKREYRIVNDRRPQPGAVSPVDCALWIVRDGRSLPVHHGRGGIVLQHGDEIYLSQAMLRFELRST
jgi:hypothetical protein